MKAQYGEVFIVFVPTGPDSTLQMLCIILFPGIWVISLCGGETLFLQCIVFPFDSFVNEALISINVANWINSVVSTLLVFALSLVIVAVCNLMKICQCSQIMGISM